MEAEGTDLQGGRGSVDRMEKVAQRDPPPPNPPKEQEHKAVGLRAGGAGGPKVKASERLRWQMRQREFLRPGT